MACRRFATVIFESEDVSEWGGFVASRLQKKTSQMSRSFSSWTVGKELSNRTKCSPTVPSERSSPQRNTGMSDEARLVYRSEFGRNKGSMVDAPGLGQMCRTGAHDPFIVL